MAVLVNKEETAEGKPGFGDALASYLHLRQVTQAQLAQSLNVSRSSVNEWVAEKSLPAPGTVFAIERALKLKPGELSIHLGFLPPDVKRPQTKSFTIFVQGLPELSDESKQALTDVYQALKKADAKRGSRPRLRRQ